jgi:hypothetical protein
VYVHVRQVLFHGLADVDVQVAVHLGRQSCLYADFSSAERRRLLGAPYDLLVWKEIAFFLSEIA